MSRANQLELISLTTNFLKATKPESCKNYRILSQEPLFRGICYGSTQYNITPEEIEQEVSKILKFNTSLSKYRAETSYDDKHLSVDNARIDEILPYIIKFKPDEISRLPIDLQKRILNQWVIFQKGFTKTRQKEFDNAYGNAMKIINMRLLKCVSESISALTDTELNCSTTIIDPIASQDSEKSLSTINENDKNEMKSKVE